MMQKSRRRLLVASVPVVMAVGLSTSLVAPAHADSGPSLTLAESHQQAFVAGGTGTYTITVGNAGTGATDGSATKVTGTLPAGMTALAAGGSGWSCKTSPSLNCARSDALGPGQAYMPITLTVGIAPSLAGKTVPSSFRVARGGPTTFQEESSLTVNVTISQTQSQSQSQSQTVNVKCPSDHDKRTAV
ncbi:hypothetical protein [Streptomyces sp. NBC_01763]|uniref:hypothetical protein n=1 Tax=Streptomyces sp. NBC_01763 TaxID=2975934 RepID=UPI002DD8E494|nr:hypothetical protein [Streptomyces sp. NBC_01763]WSC37030.1 hypothetical protein OHA08_16775 [Streptomyces sp. NBC_01763]